MKDVIAEVLEAKKAYERKRREAIALLLERRRELVAEIDAQLRQLGYDSTGSTNEHHVAPAPKTRAMRGPRKCSNCGQVGHTARTCSAPTLASGAGKGRPRLVKRAAGEAFGG